MNIIEKIERHALDLIDGECWENDYASPRQGYKRIGRAGERRRYFIHRIAWEAHNAEPIPEGMVVLHTCDNPGCFNPEHLRIGTQAENIQDSVAKGRHSSLNCPTKAA